MNKYGARQTIVDGIRFASKREAKRWAELLILQRAGEIRELERQVVILLEGRDGKILTRRGPQMRMTVDFRYQDRRLGWATVYEDAKGTPTRDYEVRRAVVGAMSIDILEV